MIEYRTQSQVFDHLACFRNLEFDFCEGTMPAGMINFTRYLANRYGKKESERIASVLEATWRIGPSHS